jgi:hypothetical protein
VLGIGVPETISGATPTPLHSLFNLFLFSPPFFASISPLDFFQVLFASTGYFLPTLLGLLELFSTFQPIPSSYCIPSLV